MLLTSCCRALWARADVLSSAALWGDFSLGQRHPAPAAKQAALEAWLARRRAGLRRLRLQCWYGQQLRPPLLETLVCDGLVELQLRHLHKEECVEPLVALLPRAAGLTRLTLSACGVKSLPVQVRLVAGGCLRVSREEPLCMAFRRVKGPPLWHGTGPAPTHTPPALHPCLSQHAPLPHPAPQLAALPNLRDLALDNNFCMGVEGCFRALSRLVTLTRLDLSYCCLAVLPKEVGATSAKRKLARQLWR